MKVRTAAVAALTCAACLVAGLVLFAQETKTEAGAAAEISELEQAAVRADLATDPSFYEKNLAETWSGGTSFGEWETKALLLKDMSDRQNHRIESEQIRDLKVRVYGDTAVATYKQTYEMLDHGRRHGRTVITTDTWVKQRGAWKEVASHSSETR